MNSILRNLRGPNIKVMVGLYVVALALRLVHLSAIAEMPTFERPAMDEYYHLQWAEQIAAGKFTSDEPFFRAPMYPYQLALMLKVTGGNLFAVRVLQSLLGSALPILVFLISLRAFNRKIALIAGGAAALYPLFIYYDTALLITSTMTLLCAGITLQSLRVREEPSPARLIALGALIGLAALARPNVLLFAALLIPWFWISLRKAHKWSGAQTALRLGRVYVVTTLMIVPVTIHNLVVSDGEIVPISWQGGYNFYLGNNHQASGWSATAPGIARTWEGSFRDVRDIPQEALGRELTVSESDRWWWRRSLAEVSENPWTFLSLAGKKTLFYFTGFEIPNNQNIYMVRRFSLLQDALLWRGPLFFPYGLIAPLALVGFALAWRSRDQHAPLYLFIVGYAASVILFFVCARFRVPTIPLLLIFASFAGVSIYEMISRQLSRGLLVIAAFVGLTLVCNIDIVAQDPVAEDAYDEAFLGEAYLKIDNTTAASQHLSRAVQLDPTQSRTHLLLGQLAQRNGNYKEGISAYLKSLEREPANTAALSALGAVYLQTNDIERAGITLRRALALDSLDYSIQFRYGMVHFRKKQHDSALYYMDRARELNPDNVPAQENAKFLRKLIKSRAGSTAPAENR